MLLTLLLIAALAATPNTDPFAFFQPSVTVSADERQQLDRGESIARGLPAHDREAAVFAAIRVDVDGDRLVAWMRHIDELKKSAEVLAIGRLSDAPTIDDLAGLVLDHEELSEILECRPGSCGLKLSAVEMDRLQRVAAGAGTDWRPRLQQAFRAMVLERVKLYLAEGQAALSPYVDHGDPVWPATRFASVLGHSLFLTSHLPQFAGHLSGYPGIPAPALESFVYWSKERLAGKTIISATHVSILRSDEPGLPDALVAGKQIFATHYVNASLGITVILRGAPGAHNYLAYVNRSEVDMLGGVFGGLARRIMQRRLKAEAATVLQELRRRLESGEPAADRAEGALLNSVVSPANVQIGSCNSRSASANCR